jgi:hypothetical protein
MAVPEIKFISCLRLNGKNLARTSDFSTTLAAGAEVHSGSATLGKLPHKRDRFSGEKEHAFPKSTGLHRSRALQSGVSSQVESEVQDFYERIDSAFVTIPGQI